MKCRTEEVIKDKFVETYDMGRDISFIDESYYAYLETFTGGQFVEPGKEDIKRSFQGYLTVFKE